MTNQLVCLLIEDNPGHAALIRAALARQGSVEVDLVSVSSGEAALTWLDRRWADLILLDLNLPGLYGLEVLQRLKADRRTRPIPVVVLTTSQAETDVVASYENYAAAYIIKPVDYRKWQTALDHIAGLYGVATLAPARNDR